MKKGFVLPLIIGLVLAVTLLGLFYWQFNRKSNSSVKNSQNPIVSEKSPTPESSPILGDSKTNGVSYLVYLKREIIEKSLNGEPRIDKYSVMIVDENGKDKKTLFSFIRDDQKPGQSAASSGGSYAQNQFYVYRISGDTDTIYFDKNGQIKEPNIFTKYGQITNGELGAYTLAGKSGFFGSGVAVSMDGNLFAYQKNKRDYNSQIKIGLLNLKDGKEKIFEIKTLIDETSGPFLFLSPDNKKLYVFTCGGGYICFGKTNGVFEINIETSSISFLDFISNLEPTRALFRHNPNSMYAIKLESFDRGFDSPGDDTPLRAKSIFKVNLNSKSVETINFNNYFGAIEISPSANFAVAERVESQSIENQNDVYLIKNFKNNDEYPIPQKWQGSAWSDSDKLAYMGSDGSQDQLVIYNPVDKTQKIVEDYKFSMDPNTCCYTLNIIGWIH